MAFALKTLGSDCIFDILVTTELLYAAQVLLL